MSRALVLLLLLGITPSVRAQVFNHASLGWLNHRLAGQVVDHTQNHGADRRIPSAALGMPRDLYVYLPPGYCPQRAYPVVLYLHMAFIDEHGFVGFDYIVELDRMIQSGIVPPMIVACPDGFINGRNHFREPHSLYANGLHARFEDHVIGEVVPFLMTHYSIRPEREAHGILAVSAGAYGGLGMAIKYRSFFGAVATLAAPANLRYATCDGNYFADFDPATYRWSTTYDPDQVIGKFYFGLRRTRAKAYIGPVYGGDPRVVPSLVARDNPADLIFTTNLQPGELAIYLNYPGRDNWNFDAHSESFQWLAASRGIAVETERVPHATHGLHYFNGNHWKAYAWLGRHLLPPT